MTDQHVLELDGKDEIQIRQSSNEIPPTWKKVQLGEVLNFIGNGLTIKQDKNGKGYPVTRIETIAEDYINEKKVGFVSDISQDELEKYRLYSGDILISHINSEPQIGRSVIYEGKPQLLLHGMNLLRLRAKADILLPHFLNYLFMIYRMHGVFIAMASRAVGQSSINQGKLKSLIVTIPPLSEQMAISKVLQAVQEAIHKRRDELELERERKAALMQHLFTYGINDDPLKQTKIGGIPQSWQVTRLGEVFTTQLGKMLSPKARVGNSPKPYMRNANVQWGYVDCSEVFEMDFDERESNKFRLEYGDILVCEGGEVGRTAIWRDELPECYFQKAIHRLRPRNSQMLPKFFLYHMERAFLYENIYGVAGTETTIAHLPQDKLVSMFIPKPPLDEQQVIAELLEACDTCILTLQREIELLEELFRSLLEELMTGRLSTQPLIEPTFRRRSRWNWKYL